MFITNIGRKEFINVLFVGWTNSPQIVNMTPAQAGLHSTMLSTNKIFVTEKMQAEVSDNWEK